MQKQTVIGISVIILIIGIAIAYFAGKSPTINTQGTNSAEGAPEGSIHNLPVPEGVGAARRHLVETLKIEENKIVIMTAFEKEWSDSCLGLGGPAESCAAVITPGYEVTMQVQGKTYVYRTDATGTSIREQR